MNAQETLKQEKPSGVNHWAGGEARPLLRFLRLLGFPGLELFPFGAALGLLLDDIVVLLLLVGLEHGANIGLGFLLAGGDFVLHGLLVSGREFVQVLLGQVFAGVPLVTHQLADLLALFLAQVQLAERAAFATRAVFTVAWATHHAAFRPTHRAWAFWHCHGNGGQGGGEHQSDKGLAHGVSPVSIPVSPDVSRLRRARSAAVRGG
ncbi:membrane hypothetical protein [Pseudomonas sp. PM2]